MRKQNPDDVRDQFDAKVESLMSFMERGQKALKGSAHEKSDVSQLSSTTFLALYVAFEKFQSDLFLAYLNRDFSQYQEHAAEEIFQSIQNKKGEWIKGRISFNTVKHVKVPDLEVIMDSKGRNLSFLNTVDMKKRAKEWLIQNHADHINSLSNHDERLLDTAKSIRNFIAHGSSSSQERMNDNLDKVAQGKHNKNLGRGKQKVKNIGSFLKATFDGKSRTVIYSDRLRDIAKRM